VELGIGRATKADAVRLRWPDLVVQAELDIPERETRRVQQVFRKPDSCPVIFTWDGTRWVYITDCLGAGSVGEITADGSTRLPRPVEAVKIEPGLLAIRDGQYVLKVAEPMDEMMYLDGLVLDVIDHPADVAVFPDERFATGGPPPTGDLVAFRAPIHAVSARNHRGADVTDVLRRHDRRMVDGFARRRWGGLAEEHWVELDFGDALKRIGPTDRLFLVLAGWTDYAYPSTIFAATQAGVPVVPPVLEKQVNGRWEPIADVGFPAGLPRVMTRDVTGLLAGFTGKLRIRTNLEVNWDQLFLAPALSANAVRITSLPLQDATLAARGFAQEFTPEGHGPVAYDHDRLEPVATTTWRGKRTKLGQVAELLRDTDDRVVVAGPGDEVTARFDARRLDKVADGWKRSFVLRATGWCKDSAAFTATSGFVMPLPFRAMKRYPPGPEERYPHPEDLPRWHTR
jgi:hypothetical protein